jgi:type VI secretion system protein ImpA
VATAAQLDLAALLAPVPGPRPAGTDVRYAGDHDQIREARRADDPTLPQGVWRHEPKRADWAAVEALAETTLRERSKDLQVAAWLAEAHVHRYGFAGLAPGMALLRELCERFWDDLFPALEPDDPTARTAPLVWLNERLPGVLRGLPLTTGPEEQPYCFADHERAQRLETIRNRDPKAAEKAEAGGAVSLAAFEEELAATPDDVLRGILGAIEAAMAGAAALEEALDRRLGRDAPGFAATRAALEGIAGLILTTLRNRPGRLAEVVRRLVGGPPPQAPQRPAAPAIAATASALPPIACREEAYRRLAEVAEYVTRNEPHSPVGPLLERALEWSAMPLEQLILRLGGESRAAPALFELLGLAGAGLDGSGEANLVENGG